MTGVHSSSSCDECADQAGLALAPLAEQHHVVAGQQRPLDLGQHGVVEADDAREPGLARAQPRQQVCPQLFLDRAVLVAGGAQLAESTGQVRRDGHRLVLRRHPTHASSLPSRLRCAIPIWDTSSRSAKNLYQSYPGIA